MMRSARTAICFLLPLSILALHANTSTEHANENVAARNAAAAYEELFQASAALKAELGDSYDALFYPGSDAPSPQISEETRKKVLDTVGASLSKLDSLANEPRVDWGREGEFEKDGFDAMLPELSGRRMLINEAKWYAKEIWASDQDRAIDTLLNAQAAARHFNQDEVTVIAHQTHLDFESMVLGGMCELSPEMSEEQCDSLIKRFHSLPATGTLADVIRAEKTMFSGRIHKKVLDQLKIWEGAHYGSNGFRFPKDLRLAGVVIQANQPARISLHNNWNGRVFWLEKGKEIDGIRLDRVERDPPRAWISKDGITAMINIQDGSIGSRYVPREVLCSAIISSNFFGPDTSEPEVLAFFEELGITAEITLDQFDLIDAYFDGAIERLDQPIEVLEAWQKTYFGSVDEDSFARTLMFKISHVAEVNKAFMRKREAFELGLKLESQRDRPDSLADPSNNGGFVVTQNENGFSLTPEEYIGHKREHSYSLHFGTPPEPEG